MIKRIEIIGLPGAGKTTLAHACLQLNVNALFENYRDNPFWANSVSGISENWLGCDLIFHLQHTNLIKNIRTTGQWAITDFSLWQDTFYAENRLTIDELKVYKAVTLHGLKNISAPNFYVFLDIEPDELFWRLKKRGRNEERSIDLTWLTEKSIALRKRLNDQQENISADVLKLSSMSLENQVNEIACRIKNIPNQNEQR